MVRQASKGAPGHSLTRRLSLAGVRVDLVDTPSSMDLLRPLLVEGGVHHISTANLDYVRQATVNPDLRRILDDAAVVVPDGMPVLWAAKLLGQRIPRRTTGHDLVEALLKHSASDGISLFLLGSARGVGEQAAINARKRYPGVQIVGVYSPPLRPFPFPKDEDDEMVKAVNMSGADVLLVAFGCPKQDLWIDAHRHELRVSVAIGVGSVLDVMAGVTRRAPNWLQAAGLEWLYRLTQEPGRLWRRYLVHDIPFLMRLLVMAASARYTTPRGSRNEP